VSIQIKLLFNEETWVFSKRLRTRPEQSSVR